MADPKAARREQKKSRTAAPARPISAAWAAAILAVLLALFFHEVLAPGRTFVSPDALAPAGFVHVGEQSLWKDHVYPLWNPYVFLGMPSFASGAYNPLIYPPDWPLALIQKILPLPDMTWLLLYYFLGAWFFFLLAREWGARAEGALIGAMAFVFAPNLVAVGSHGHGSQLVDSAYLPLMLWLASRWIRRGGLKELGLLALAGGFQMLRGHVQICFYSWLAVAIYGVIDGVASLRGGAKTPGASALPTVAARAIGLAGAAAAAFAIAAFYNLPLQDYAHWSIRGGGAGGGIGMERATQWSMSPIELPTIVFAGFAGFGGQTYWGGMPFTDYPNAYIGIVTALLALPAFLANGRVRVFALALALVSLLIAFGHNTPLYQFLYDHLPLFNKFRVPVMIILLFQLAACLGVAWGWSAVLEGRGPGAPRVGRLMAIAGVVVAAGAVIASIGRDGWRGAYQGLAMATHPGFPAQAASIAFESFARDLMRAGLVGGLAALTAWLAFTRRMPGRIATVVAAALLLFELWPVSGMVMKPVIGDTPPPNAEIGRDDVTDFLSQAAPRGTFRIFPADQFQDNRFAGFGIASIGGYHAAKLRRFQDFYDAQLQGTPGWMRLLNIRYVVLQQALEKVPEWMKLVHQGPGGAVYENLAALPRATLVDQYRVVQPAKAILDSVAEVAHDSARLTFLEEDPHVSLGPIAGGTATIVSARLNDVTIDVNTPGPALLRLADQWYPDWVATVDGRAAPILRADYLLRAVAVPAGRHQVKFEFRSRAMRTGLLLSVIATLLALAAIGIGWGRERSARAAAAAAPKPGSPGAA